MIPLGGPPLCGACRTIMHEPREDCPTPYTCLTGRHCPACRAR